MSDSQVASDVARGWAQGQEQRLRAELTSIRQLARATKPSVDGSGCSGDLVYPDVSHTAEWCHKFRVSRVWRVCCCSPLGWLATCVRHSLRMSVGALCMWLLSHGG
jgi:hypothetical protein